MTLIWSRSLNQHIDKLEPEPHKSGSTTLLPSVVDPVYFSDHLK